MASSGADQAMCDPDSGLAVAVVEGVCEVPGRRPSLFSEKGF
jgi:hypothetical protein